MRTIFTVEDFKNCLDPEMARVSANLNQILIERYGEFWALVKFTEWYYFHGQGD